MKYHYFVFDATNLYHRVVYASLKKMVSPNIIPHVVIMDFLARIKNIVSLYSYNYSNSKIFLLFDNTDSKVRKRQEIDSTYKQSRENKPEIKGFAETLMILQEIIKNYNNNYYFAQMEGFEADDLVYLVKKQAIKLFENERILLISADLDWARGIDETTDWFNYHEFYDKNSFKNKHGFSPIGNSIKIFKAIHGDTSDDVKNVVPYLPREILLNIVNNFATLEDFFEKLDTLEIPEKWKEKIKEAKENIERNYKLVDFFEKETPLQLIQCVVNMAALKFLFTKFKIPQEARMNFLTPYPFFERSM